MNSFDFIVVGGGIAGGVIGLELKRSGYRVGVLEKRGEFLEGASGAAGAFLFPKVGLDTLYTRFINWGIKLGMEFWQRAKVKIEGGGVLILPRNEKDSEKFNRYRTEIGLPMEEREEGFYFPIGGVVEVTEVKELFKRELILIGEELEKLEWKGTKGWIRVVPAEFEKEKRKVKGGKKREEELIKESKKDKKGKEDKEGKEKFDKKNNFQNENFPEKRATEKSKKSINRSEAFNFSPVSSFSTNSQLFSGSRIIGEWNGKRFTGFEKREMEEAIKRGFWIINGKWRAKGVILALGAEGNRWHPPYLQINPIWGERIGVITSTPPKFHYHKQVSVSVGIPFLKEEVKDGYIIKKVEKKEEKDKKREKKTSFKKIEKGNREKRVLSETEKGGNGEKWIVKIGATHRRNCPDCTENWEEAFRLLQLAREIIPIDGQIVSIKGGFRGGTRDFFPVVGAVLDWEGTLFWNPRLPKGVKLTHPRYLPGLFIINGMGGRGFSNSILTAYWLKKEILNTFSIMPTHFSTFSNFSTSSLPSTLQFSAVPQNSSLSFPSTGSILPTDQSPSTVLGDRQFKFGNRQPPTVSATHLSNSTNQQPVTENLNTSTTTLKEIGDLTEKGTGESTNRNDTNQSSNKQLVTSTGSKPIPNPPNFNLPIKFDYTQSVTANFTISDLFSSTDWEQFNRELPPSLLNSKLSPARLLVKFARQMDRFINRRD